jgi:hypothetical protein
MKNMVNSKIKAHILGKMRRYRAVVTVILLVIVLLLSGFVVLPLLNQFTPPEGQYCLFSDDCERPLICGPNGRCRAQCRTSRDCGGGWVCLSGTCADPRMRPAQAVSEWNTNRPGNDYADISVGSMDDHSCREACEADSRCAAYTYVRAGIQGLTAHCWLKDAHSPPVPDNCCISGIVRPPPTPAYISPAR